MPRRNPPSINTGTLPPTASTQSGSASSVPITPSNCRPPWFETTIASAPYFTANAASSGFTIPFTINGIFEPSLNHAICSHVICGVCGCHIAGSAGDRGGGFGVPSFGTPLCI